jgi:uncharacterized membrane protein
MKTFSIGGFVIGVSLLYFAINMLAGAWDEERFNLLSLILLIAGIVVTTIIQIGYTKIFLKLHDGGASSVKDLFTHYPLFWKYIGTNILYSLIVLGGFILLIVPGIIFALMYAFSLLIVVDKGTGPLGSLRQSKELTRGVKWDLFLFWLVVIGINVLGVIALGVGLLVSVPVSTLAFIHVYRKLASQNSPAEVVPEGSSSGPRGPESTITA